MSIPAPKVMTPDVQADYGVDEYSTLQIVTAERSVLTRYVPKNAQNVPLGSFAALGPVLLKPQLKQYVGTVVDPDLSEMPDDLIYAIRLTIKNYLEAEEEEVTSSVESISEGSRSISYDGSQGKIDRDVFEPLRLYDNRQPLSFL